MKNIIFSNYQKIQHFKNKGHLTENTHRTGRDKVKSVCILIFLPVKPGEQSQWKVSDCPDSGVQVPP